VEADPHANIPSDHFPIKINCRIKLKAKEKPKN
jgi:hypothetical protein